MRKILFTDNINPFMYFCCYLPTFYCGLKGFWLPVIPIFIVSVIIDRWGRSYFDNR